VEIALQSWPGVRDTNISNDYARLRSLFDLLTPLLGQFSGIRTLLAFEQDVHELFFVVRIVSCEVEPVTTRTETDHTMDFVIKAAHQADEVVRAVFALHPVDTCVL
jgi:hypothetical protein